MWMREVSNIIAGKSCTIVGSAPNPVYKIEESNKDNKIICVKGSGYSAKLLNLPDPDVTFQAEWGFIDNLETLNGLRSKNVIQVCQHIFNQMIYENTYKKINYTYDNLFIFDDALLSSFYNSDIFIDEKPPQNGHPMSYGIGVLLICQCLGVKDIIITGINPGSTGRTYENGRPTLDVHKDVDIFIMNKVQQAFGNLYTYEEELASKTKVKLLR